MQADGKVVVVGGTTNGDFNITRVSANEAATFECKIDKANYASCTSPFKTKKLKPGKHTFTVQARDTAGNVDGTAATQSFTVKKKEKKKK